MYRQRIRRGRRCASFGSPRVSCISGPLRRRGTELRRETYHDERCHPYRPPHRSTSSRSTSTARCSRPTRRSAPATAPPSSDALAAGIRVVLVTGRGVDTPIRVSRELGPEPAGDLLPRRADQGLRREQDARAHPGAAAVRQADGRVRRARGARGRRSTSRRRSTASRARTSSWTTCAARAGTRRPRCARSSPRRRRSSASWARSRSRRCMREFGDLPLSFRYETWCDFVECAVLNREASKKNALARAVRRLRDPGRARAGDRRLAQRRPDAALGRDRRRDGQRAARGAPVGPLRDRAPTTATASRWRSSGSAAPRRRRRRDDAARGAEPRVRERAAHGPRAARLGRRCASSPASTTRSPTTSTRRSSTSGRCCCTSSPATASICSGCHDDSRAWLAEHGYTTDLGGY